MSSSKPEHPNYLKKCVQQYVYLLKNRPVITKACTSAFTGALGALLSQLLGGKPGKIIKLRTVAAYAAVGFVFIGPSVHYFHAWLDKNIPKSDENMAIKRLLVDRILFCPTFLFVYLYLLALFEGSGGEAISRIKEAYWPSLLINYKVWTPLQYLNVKYIPQQFRAPFMSFMALLWTIYIAMKRR